VQEGTGPESPSGAGNAVGRAPLDELVRSSSLIFVGTVVERGRSTLAAVPHRDDLYAVRVDRGLRVDPALGDLSGRTVTVAPATADELKSGEQAVFFTRSWIVGQGIAVREVEHMDAAAMGDVAAAVERLPRLDLRDRLLEAELVVLAEVREVRQLPRTTFERDAAFWAVATLQVERVLRGQPGSSAEVYFPTAVGPRWKYAPRFEQGQRGIFVLHPPRGANPSEQSLEPASLVALDPRDFQPESSLAEVESLLPASEEGRP
jgi:hypothetical protein